jgi:hypothetical protein
MGAALPVVVEVERPDGSQEFVQVGTARRDGAFFVLDLSTLRISPLESQPAPSAGPPPKVEAPPPAQGGTIEDLEYIAARARRTLADKSKERWHAQERSLLEQVERELLRWRAAGQKPG